MAPLALGAALLLFPVLAEAQQARGLGEVQLLRQGANVNAKEINPFRDLTLRAGVLEAYSGPIISLNDGNYFRPVTLPLGAGYGLTNELEVGADLLLDFASPDPLSAFQVQEPRLYGRYSILPGQLAIEGSLFIPVSKDLDRLGYRIELPGRYTIIPELIVYGAVSYSAMFGSSTTTYTDFTQVGGTAMYRFAEKVWGALELGLTLRNFNFDHALLPLGISAGYEFVPGIAILPGFRFPDIGTPANRSLTILVVYTWDVGSVAPPSRDPSTPDIPPSTPSAPAAG